MEDGGQFCYRALTRSRNSSVNASTSTAVAIPQLPCSLRSPGRVRSVWWIQSCVAVPANAPNARPPAAIRRACSRVRLTWTVTSRPTRRSGAPLPIMMAAASGSTHTLNSPGMVARLVCWRYTPPITTISRTADATRGSSDRARATPAHPWPGRGPAGCDGSPAGPEQTALGQRPNGGDVQVGREVADGGHEDAPAAPLPGPHGGGHVVRAPRGVVGGAVPADGENVVQAVREHP